jgi:erythromycin esterase
MERDTLRETEQEKDMSRRNRISGYEEPISDQLLRAVQGRSLPLEDDYTLDPLIERIGDSHFVLLGEASHGTAEYYTWRARISERLIREKGFSFIAVEGDWPDCYRVNRYIKGHEDGGTDAHEVLHAFERWPTWMWANEEIAELAEGLRQHNALLADEKKVGFYGLDVYSLWDSLYQVMGYLHRMDPSALEGAIHQVYRCFEPYGEDVQRYARATVLVPTSCEKEVIELLRQLRERALDYRRDDPEGYFVVEQNATVLKNAEAYYRAMIHPGPESWNIRDQHMVQTLERLMRHHGAGAKAIVWEHNTHIGDARYTDMADEGMVNVGQLVRERHVDQGVVLVGFGCGQGSVIAGSAWDAPMQRMRVPEARVGSWENVLRQASDSRQLLIFAPEEKEPTMLQPRGHRAIGVVYHPAYEHLGNYVPTVLPRRYDAFLFFPETHALHPLHVPVHEEGEVSETYPSGL